MEKTQKKIRESNIELCRIIAMLMIILHHAVCHGGGLGMADCANKWIAFAFFPGGKIAFVTFIVITCWFLVDSSFKSERFIKVWMTTLFYSILTTILAAVMGSEIKLIEWFGAFLPITGYVHGYAQLYLAFYLLLPFLSKISKNITKGQNQFIVAVMTLLVIVSRVMGSFSWSEQSVYSRLTLFVYIFFITMYLKRYPIKLFENVWACAALFILIYAAIYGYFVGATVFPDFFLWKYVAPHLSDEGGLLNMAAGMLLFFIFKNIKIKPNRVINLFGGATLAVILIHDGHFSRGWTWHFLHTSEWYYNDFYVLLLNLSGILIYCVCVGIELFRRYMIEEPMFSAAFMKKFCGRIDNWIKDIDPKKAVTDGSVIEEGSGSQNREASLDKAQEETAGHKQQ